MSYIIARDLQEQTSTSHFSASGVLLVVEDSKVPPSGDLHYHTLLMKFPQGQSPGSMVYVEGTET